MRSTQAAILVLAGSVLGLGLVAVLDLSGEERPVFAQTDTETADARDVFAAADARTPARVDGVSANGSPGVPLPRRLETDAEPEALCIEQLLDELPLVVLDDERGFASLKDTNEHLVEAAEKASAKVQRKLAKRQAAADSAQAQLEAALQVLADAQAVAEAAEAARLEAEQALADALSMAAGTPQEIAARKLAVAAAQKALKKASKAARATAKTSGQKQKQADAKQKAADKKQQAADELADILAGLTDQIACLTGDFNFQYHVDVPLQVNVTAEGVYPLIGVRLSLVDAFEVDDVEAEGVEPPRTTRLHWQGQTNAEGVCVDTLRLSGAQDVFDLVVTCPDHTGEYSAEGLRDVWGPFAPAARVRVSADELAELSIELTPKQD